MSEFLQSNIRDALEGDRFFRGALSCLHGKPVGGWAETRQALRELRDALPVSRDYAVSEWIEAVYEIRNDRYWTRPEYDRPVWFVVRRASPCFGVVASGPLADCAAAKAERNRLTKSLLSRYPNAVGQGLFVLHPVARSSEFADACVGDPLRIGG